MLKLEWKPIPTQHVGLHWGCSINYPSHDKGTSNRCPTIYPLNWPPHTLEGLRAGEQGKYILLMTIISFFGGGVWKSCWSERELVLPIIFYHLIYHMI